MTLIIGMYYNNKKGALIASESRITEGFNVLRLTEKIAKVRGVLLSLSGLAYLSDAIIEELEENLEDENESKEIRKIIQEAYATVKETYCSKENEILSPKKFCCNGMFGFWGDKPELYEVTDKGRISPLYDLFTANGQEESYVEGILRTIYKENLSKEQAIQTAAYCLVEVSKFNVGIDDNIQIATIEDGESKILNYDKDGTFNFRKPEIVKKRNIAKSIAKQQKIALDILLNGNEKSKGKLEKLLNELKRQ